MEKYTLSCFKNFKCTGSSCSDNCCIGWEIDVDKKTLDFYKNINDDFIKDNIDFKNSRIIMKKDGRCPFLNSDNLCDIIIKYKEENISYICTHHPRFYNEFDNFCEYGYGLCCEEACRLLLNYCEEYEHPESENELFIIRKKLFSIIKDKNLSLREKIYSYLDFICEAEEVLFMGENTDELIKNYKTDFCFDKQQSLDCIFSVLNSTEPIDSNWTHYIKRVYDEKENIEKCIEKVCRSEKYEKLLYYYTFRYFLKENEYDITERGKFVIFLVLSNIIFDTYSYLLNKNDYLKNTVILSKQLEYSQNNIDSVLRECLENSYFDFDKIINII